MSVLKDENSITLGGAESQLAKSCSKQIKIPLLFYNHPISTGA